MSFSEASSYEEGPTSSYIQWLKIGNVSFMTFVGSDIVAFGHGCFIFLFNTTTNEETIYTANSVEKGEGVGCLVGYQQAYMFAFAEFTTLPRIFLVTHPSQEHICILKDPMTTPHSYVAMAFAEMECLICLTGLPTFEIIVWCWRTRTKLASHPTGVTSARLQLRCSVSMPIGVCLLANYEHGSEFQLWQVSICGKLCLLTKSDLRQGLDANTHISSFAWSPEGTLMVADANGNLYLVKEETQSFLKVLTWPYITRETSAMYPTNTLWWKNGVVMSGPNGFIQYIRRISNTDFQPGWCISNEGPLLVMAVNRARDTIVGWSQRCSLVMLKFADQNASLEEITHFGAPVRLMSLVHPADRFLATLNIENVVNVWNISTGELESTIEIPKGFVLDMKCNPELPYLALGRSDGVLQILAVNHDEVFSLNELYLCSEEITGVVFNKLGTLIVAASYKIGRIFVTQGMVGTGNKINVLNHVLTNQPIVNMHIMTNHIIGSSGEVNKLVTLCKYNVHGDASTMFGDMLDIYNLPKLTLEKRVVLNTVYTSLVYDGELLMAAPHVSSQIHYFDPAKVLEDFDEFGGAMPCKVDDSGHKIRRFDIGIEKNHIISWGWDGMVILRSLEGLTLTPFCTLQLHNRFTYGVAFATLTYTADYLITLSRTGNVICCRIVNKCGHNNDDHVANISNESYFTRRPPTSTKTTTVLGSSPHPKTWLETQTQQKLNLEASIATPEISNIIALFKEVQKELVQLLDDNYRAPPEEQLDILEFDLDTEAREAVLAEAEAEREHTRRLLEAECLDCQRLAEVIKNNTWDTMAVKSRSIKAMLADFSVDNYGLQPKPPTQEVELIWECEARKLSVEMAQGDHFEPWFPISEESRTLDALPSAVSEKTEKEDVEEEKENPYLFFGSSSYQFVDISPLHCSQFEISTSFNSVSEIVMLQKVCQDLREYFNKRFDDMFVAKEREMALLTERNTRLRTILSELEVTCSAPMDVSEPVDPEWSQEEKTERIVTIEDSEVSELPYISPSEQDLLDKKAAEEERIRRLLAADNFRELALIEMMDGMLEVRWEDELKKEVPKPKCLLEEKDPEDYTEGDIKALREYEEKCRILTSERERYRKMLEAEYKKLEHTIQESLTKFDNHLFELFQKRLKVDAAMNHEQLKMLRIYQLNDDRIRRELQEREIIHKVALTERDTESAHKQLTQMQEATAECRANYEAMVLKDKTLGKRFRQEFVNTPATPAIVEQLAKLFRRRPKMQQKATLYPTLLFELARCVVENDNTSFMPPEFHEYLALLETLDTPVGVFDEIVWGQLVRVRRAKIEAEFKVRAHALELKEAEYTLSVVMKQVKAAREQANSNVAELKAAREEKMRLSRDLQVQLVMKQGHVEAPLSGHIDDFKYAVLINPKIVENINQHVRAAGAKKLEAMKQVTKYHRINKYKEWEFKKMKMECEDLEEKLNNIESIKVTLEVKQYLKDRDKPPKEKEAQEEDANFLRMTEENYKAAVKVVTDEISATQAKIAYFKQLNAQADRNILDLKCDVSEQQFERDLELEQSLSEASRRRMSMIVKRTKLVSKIQEVHNENLVLQTELELLRLRTYPTLKYKAPI